MHAEPDPSQLPLHDDALCLSSPLSSGLCSTFHSHSWGSVHVMPWLLSYLSSFSLYHAKRYYYLLYRPVSTSPFLLIPEFLSSCHLREFVWLLHRPLCFSSSSWREDSSGCMLALVGRWARWEGDIAEVEYTHVAAFAMCITWTPCTFCFSSGHSNWFFPLPPRNISILWKASAQTGGLGLRVALAI